jgi:hypothetical protein
VSPASIGWIVLGCVFGGALLGMVLHLILPEHHLASDSKDVIKLGMSLTATMSALVLALLIASAKSSYDAQRNEITQMSANIILFDRILAKYWPETTASTEELDPTAIRADALYDKIEQLSPQNDTQSALKAQALKMGIDLAQTRWLLFEQRGSSIPSAFLVLLIFWVTIIFLSFGLFAPPNATVIVTLFLCALSVSGAIFLILQLDRPFGGLIRISSAPLHSALVLGQ